jgi:hypothetical protein
MMKHYEYITDILIIGGALGLMGWIIYGVIELVTMAIGCAI